MPPLHIIDPLPLQRTKLRKLEGWVVFSMCVWLEAYLHSVVPTVAMTIQSFRAYLLLNYPNV